MQKSEKPTRYYEDIIQKTLDFVMSRLKELVVTHHLHNYFVQGEIAAYKYCLTMCSAWKDAYDYLGWDKDDV